MRPRTHVPWWGRARRRKARETGNTAKGWLEKKELRILLVLLVLLLLVVVVVVAVWKERFLYSMSGAGLDSCAVVVPASSADDDVVVCGCDGVG